MKYPTLYKLDSKGNIREWYMEVDGNRYRTIAGIKDGNLVTSEWTVTEGKNIGRSNETTPEEQAISEVESQYDKKLRVDYHKDVNNIKKNKIFKPMLATSWDKRKDKIDFSRSVYLQPKLDGIRCIATAEGLFSRTGKEIVAVPHIRQLLKSFFEWNPDAVLDGELYNHELKDDFNEIVSMVRKTKPTDEDIVKSECMVQYHVYDIPSLGHLPFGERWKQWRIHYYHHNFPTPIQKVETIECYTTLPLDEEYARFIGEGYEGGIIRLDGPYEQKRSNNLIKRKEFEDAEFEIIRIEEGLGNWSGMAKKVVFRNDDGREVGAGLKGTQEYARQVLDEADDYIGKQVTVQFFTRTPDGVPRFPIAKALHKDKRW